MTSTPHYLIGDKRFYNQYLAWKEILDTKREYRFVCYEDEYDKLDWTKEPSESWDQICLEKCSLLRQKYQKLSLFYSAGRDSHHILNCFDKFTIPLDQLILIEPPLQPSKYWEFENCIVPMARQYKQRWPQCQIKIIKFDYDLFNQYYTNNWLEKKSMTLTQGLFNPVHFGWLTEYALHADLNHGVIVGLEKPRIILEDGKFYSVILDKSVEVFLSNSSNFELFYYSPDYPKIHLKQTWMMLNHLEKYYSPVTSKFLHNFCANTYSIYYDEFCRSCGRGTAWNLNLDLQNGKNKYQHNGKDSKIVTTIDHALAEDWKSVYHYNDAFNYLKNSMPRAFNQGDPRLGTIGIWGKKYYLKDQKPNAPVVELVDTAA